MSTYTQIIYHVVFATKHRRPVMVEKDRETFFRYVWGFMQNKECRLYQINAVEDHVHLLFALHPTIALADLIRVLKTGTSSWIREQGMFPGFDGWQTGYGAFTHSFEQKETLVQYIKHQQKHHRRISFKEELRQLLNEAGVHFDPEYIV